MRAADRLPIAKGLSSVSFYQYRARAVDHLLK
jgi:hypothetical protein